MKITVISEGRKLRRLRLKREEYKRIYIIESEFNNDDSDEDFNFSISDINE